MVYIIIELIFVPPSNSYYIACFSHFCFEFLGAHFLVLVLGDHGRAEFQVSEEVLV